MLHPSTKVCENPCLQQLLSVCMSVSRLFLTNDRTYCVSYTFFILFKARVSQCKCLLAWHPSIQIRPQCLHSFSHCCLVYLLAPVSSVEWQPEPVRGTGLRCSRPRWFMTPLMSIFSGNESSATAHANTPSLFPADYKINVSSSAVCVQTCGDPA